MNGVEQYVVAYRVNAEKLQELIPDGFCSLRPVLRINAEIISHQETAENYIYLELNTPVEGAGKRGWLNIASWRSDRETVAITETRRGKRVAFSVTEHHKSLLSIMYKGVGIAGGCPHEADNDGTFYRVQEQFEFKPAERIDANKEFCDCELTWHAADGIETDLHKAMQIPVDEILGAYTVSFKRDKFEEQKPL